jgi:hypothetical protein
MLASLDLNNEHTKSLLFLGKWAVVINPVNSELNPICHLLALLGAHHILHVSRISVNVEGYILQLCVLLGEET